MALHFTDFCLTDLFQVDTLNRLDEAFLSTLQHQNTALHEQLLAYRNAQSPLTPLQISELLLAVAPILESFLTAFFAIEAAVEKNRQAVKHHQPLFTFKKWFVQRRARRRLNKTEELESFAELEDWLNQTLAQPPCDLSPVTDDRELGVALLGNHYLQAPDKYATEIEKLTRWCIRALTTLEGQAVVKEWVSFKVPQRLDHDHLVPLVAVENDKYGRLEGSSETSRQRYGFKLTDLRMSSREVHSEIDYCVYCHDHEGDFCSKGFPVRKDPVDKHLKIDPLGNVLTGCPLEEKISEMHLLKREGYPIAALAVLMVDNPLCPLTGHRICNDCMKACIYQKQDPVNIPQIETRILTEVLAFPWGVEIYDLLVRWNPLRHTQWVPKPYNGLKVLVVGQGPAGVTLAHHLLMEGFAVVGVDGLKIEPLPPELVNSPIESYTALQEALDQRITLGFGGVAEYGITVRWDKNFLKLVYLSLLRRPTFQVFGGIRFGGTVTIEDAWKLGFHHVAIAVGAGLPQALPIPGSLAPGMRQANDFLMALQLTGAAKENSLANLQVRLPAVIVGGGLTGIDTATEVQAYYLTQIEKTLIRYQQLVTTFGEAPVRESLDPHSLLILDEFLAHAKQWHAEQARAQAVGELPNGRDLLRQWGGVTVVYRRSLRESPAYVRNHEEVIKALEEGIFYVEHLNPKAIQRDEFGHVQALVCSRSDSQGTDDVILPARAVFVATGAKPNVAYGFEHRGTLERQDFQYVAYHEIDGRLQPAPEVKHCKEALFGPFTSYAKAEKRVTFIGDTHPVFHGSVVKAIASGMRTYPHIVHSLQNQLPSTATMTEYAGFRQKLESLLTARLIQIQRLAHDVVEIKIYAPQAARQFKPGQFFRIQNFETLAPTVGGTRLQTEAIALLGTGVEQESGMLSFTVLEQGASSRLFATFRLGEPIALMGPTGIRTKIPEGQETILIIGNRLSIVFVRAVGTALRQAGNRVLLIVTLQTANDVFYQNDIEAVTDAIVWITEQGQPVKIHRSQDVSATGDFLDIVHQYASRELFPLSLSTVNRVMIIGDSQLIRQIDQARRGIWQSFFNEEVQFNTTVHSAMQCMLKGICAQCLQWQIDPTTGKRTKAVFACSWQEQPLEIIEIDNLNERLVQNRLQEQLTNKWLDYLFNHFPVEKV